MNIAVVGGAGHVGLPLAAMLASVGHHVRAIDTDTERIRSIQGGRSPFYEPGLDNILARVLADATLTLHTDLTATEKCDVVFVVVGTDLSDDHVPQNETVFGVIRQLRDVVSTSTVVVLRSTVMPGTTATTAEMLHGRVEEVAFCPERIAEGRAVEELQTMPQLIGTRSGQPSAVLSQLFASLGVESIWMTWKEAELGKLMLNSWRYTQFAVANEFRKICEFQDVSFRRVRDAILDQYPRGQGLMGPGFAGGPCLKKDTLQLLSGINGKSELLEAVLESHRSMTDEVVKEVVSRIRKHEMVVVQLGLTFKPGSDDLRGSVALELAIELTKHCKKFLVVDPHVESHPDLTIVSLDAALARADLVVLGTRHPEFVDLQIGVPCIDMGGFRLFNESGRVE